MANQYFVRAKSGPEAGPMAGNDVRALVRSGELTGSDLIRKDTSASWMTIESVPQLAADLPKAAPAPPDELGMHEVAAPRPMGSTATFSSPSDVQANKVMAIIGYIFPLLFFIPLVTDAKTSPFARFHANQQLVFLILYFCASLLSGALMIILIGWCLFAIVVVASLAHMIQGILNASSGKMTPLLLIGAIKIIK